MYDTRNNYSSLNTIVALLYYNNKNSMKYMTKSKVYHNSGKVQVHTKQSVKIRTGTVFYYWDPDPDINYSKVYNTPPRLKNEPIESKSLSI